MSRPVSLLFSFHGCQLCYHFASTLYRLVHEVIIFPAQAEDVVRRGFLERWYYGDEEKSQ